MIKVFSNSFHWKNTQGAKLIAKLVMGDLKCKKQVIMNFIPVYHAHEIFVVQMFQVLF